MCAASLLFVSVEIRIFSPVPALPAFTISLSPKKEAGKHRKHKGASRSPALSYEDVLSELSALTKTRWTFRLIRRKVAFLLSTSCLL